ncbi:unnamed protein product [Blepharisma stoltei]|uniref:Uncharacterized protein n=1 Tax=Blepharisma stoltei TaxID=1481888 RepID=A0AAU9K5V6_9CILI|nr:unnamed protein product [Blepharisma stoltei]
MKLGAAGFTEWLLFHLWKQNESTGLCCPNVLLPETVIYRYAKPFFWYFSTESGELLRKSKTRVNHKFIFQEFMDEKSKIIATFLGFSDNKKDKANIATVDFFNPESFDEFIHNCDKPLSGILQKWVDPKNGQNSLIKVIWSSQFCLLEKRTNLHSIDDPKIDFYDKLVTYEGLEHNSKIDSLSSPWLVEEIQKTCLGIVDHIKAVTGGNVTVTRMTLFFKQDCDDLIWFQFCSSLKVLDLTKQKKDNCKVSHELILTISNIANEKKIKSTCKFSELRKNRELCIGCDHLVRREYMYKILLKLVLKYSDAGKDPQSKNIAEHSLVNNDGSEDACDLVPIVLRRLNPALTNAKYEELKKDPLWLFQEVKVCEDCYLQYTNFYAEPKKLSPLKPKPHKTESKFHLNTEKVQVLNKNSNLRLRRDFSLDTITEINKTIAHISFPTLKPKTNQLNASSIIANKAETRPIAKTFEIKLPLFSTESYKRAIAVYGRKPLTNFSTETSLNYSRNKSFDHINYISKEKEGEFIKDTISTLKVGLSKLKEM